MEEREAAEQSGELAPVLSGPVLSGPVLSGSVNVGPALAMVWTQEMLDEAMRKGREMFERFSRLVGQTSPVDGEQK